MDAATVPPVLAERLGPDATVGLLEVLGAIRNDCVEHVMTQSVERFERRLVEEISKVRIELHEQISGLRSELHEQIGGLRSDLRHEMAALGQGLRQEMGTQRVELLKWSFIFWVGQVIAVAGIMSALLRASGR